LARAARTTPAVPRTAEPRESAEPFVPLPYAARVSPEESLDVIRVKLPRSAIMRFGFPVSPDRVWEPVTADLVVGQDGMARAIRFVR
jgi:hypothetical protein